ncbi:MAG: 50S ribosomal protein L6 [Deltaproteobacteria bacterium]|nr:50S ribosomal protein L6 [Deltaproteobacteria bacterium]
MSRIGKIPVAVPNGVKAAFSQGVVSVEGPRGKLEFRPGPGVDVQIENGEITVKAGKQGGGNIRADYGTARATINNMVHGVSTGWKRSLELVGVGFNADAQGQKLTLSVGFSHKVVVEVPKEVKAAVRTTAQKTVIIDLESADRQLLGTIAQKIRKVQPPEPYLGKGIKYSDESIRRKAGKTGKK